MFNPLKVIYNSKYKYLVVIFLIIQLFSNVVLSEVSYENSISYFISNNVVISIFLYAPLIFDYNPLKKYMAKHIYVYSVICILSFVYSYLVLIIATGEIQFDIIAIVIYLLNVSLLFLLYYYLQLFKFTKQIYMLLIFLIAYPYSFVVYIPMINEINTVYYMLYYSLDLVSLLIYILLYIILLTLIIVKSKMNRSGK